jgi:hypothetical protein
LYYGDVFGEEYGENGWFAGGGGGSLEGEIGYECNVEVGKGGKGGGGKASPGAEGAEDALANTGGGGGGGNQGQNDNENQYQMGGDGGSGIVLIRYETGPSICDRRGPLNECISNSSHSVSGRFFNISSVFQVEDTAVFEALSGTATIEVENSTSLSGLWEGSFNISTSVSEKSVLRPGASFRPENGRIIIG